MGAAAAIVLRRQRDIVYMYLGAGATSPADARAPGDLGVESNRIFRGLVNRAVLRDAGNGRYYLDEASWKALNRGRRRAVLIVVLLAALVTLLVSLNVIAKR
ncbi:MAG TPA: hypothetical protein VN706_14535 [Gemmatimonadaceae bacterium]|nr:hypothetical protein [Gemmatimonadaceae bacterium]